MKTFDIHIGLSDAAIEFGKDPNVLGFPNERFPNQFDYFRAKQGGLDIFCGMICPITFENENLVLPEDQEGEINKHMNFYKKEEALENLKIIKNKQDLSSSKLKVILGLEGVYFLKEEKDILLLRNLIKYGIKVFGIKWNFESNLFDKNRKLTLLGKEFFKICATSNIIIDVAHAESDLIENILGAYSGPIMDSHTCMYSINPAKRNIKDEFVKEIINRNGLIGLNFVGEFVGGNSMSDLLKHIEYFVGKFGANNLAIGSDFDGMERSDLIENIADVSMYAALQKSLKTILLNDLYVEKIFYKNAHKYFSSLLP